MKTRSFFAITLLAITGLVSACAPVAPQASNTQIRSMYINGTGTSEITPDIAYINIGVHTEASTAAIAVSMNNTRSQKVMTTLQEFGIQAKDLRTSNFSIATLQKNDPQTGQFIETYYAVDNNIIVTARDLPKLGSLLDKAIKAGANNINNIQFDVADNTAALQQARGEAMQNALKQAGELADAAGITLGDIQTINYSESIPVFAGASYMDYGKGGGGGVRADYSVPVNPGQMTLSATVNITFAIK
jgi:uncharacterized protein YggE